MSNAYCEIDPLSGIATITINRPEVLNAIDVETAEALRDAVQPLAGNDSVRCILLRGEGRAFVAGGDVASFAEDFDKTAEVVDQLLNALHPVIETLHAHPAPVVCAVQGAAAGAGLSLMAGCDLVVAAEGARFLLAYNQIGASPDCGGSWYLPRILGRRRVAELMYLGAQWDTEQALSYGLINRVVPAAELDKEVASWVAKIARGPSLANAAFKRLVDQSLDTSLSEQLEAERAAFKGATQTADFEEGVTAFLEKRRPEFKGQ